MIDGCGWYVEGLMRGHGALKDAIGRIHVATEERALELVADGAAHGVLRTYRRAPPSGSPDTGRAEACAFLERAGADVR